MDLETAKKAVDFIMNNHYEKLKYQIDKDELGIPNVTFFGGEPTLLFNQIIVPLVEYAEEKSNPISPMYDV